jgi:peptide/nickel transport system substrate-binding protein
MADQINLDAYAVLKKDPRVVPALSPSGTLLFFHNEKQGVMANQKLRQAVELALDMQPIMQATFGNPDLYALDPAYFPRGNDWHTTAGQQWYNVHDAARAAQLMKEAGYTGQPVRWLTTQQYDWAFKSTVVATSQLQHVGFDVDMQVIDWASLLARRARPSEWDMFTTAAGCPPDPSMLPFMQATYPGWWDTPAKAQLLSKFVSASDKRQRQQLWADLQAQIYVDVPCIRAGNFATFTLCSKAVRGFRSGFQLTYWPILWNVQVVK